MPLSLISAKLEGPRPRPGFLDRPDLIDRLDRGLEGKVTLISAPAGYGKSILVAQWLDRSSAPQSAWLSLDRLDGDLERFTRYVVAALRRVDPRCLERTEALLSSHMLPPPEYLAETMAVELEHLERRTVLVLDDFETIRGEAVHRLVRCLVPNLSENLHLALLSRVDPPLPVGLWRNRDWLVELRGVDLRFSREEARAFFEAAAEIELSDAAIDVVHRRTEGWIAGLRLALISVSASADPEERVRAFSGTDRLVVDYLMQEVLASQPLDVRQFLALTAPLERFCAPLCDHLIDAGSDGVDSRGVLDRLYRGNMFVFPLGEVHGWYRYHHLFRDLLVDRFDDLAPTLSRADICRRAGSWFAGEGWLEEALQYLVAAGDLDAAADVVAAHLHEVMAHDLSRRTLARWLSLFPSGAERGRLPLLVAKLYLGTLHLDVGSLSRLLDLSWAAVSDGANERQQRWSFDLRSDLEFMTAFVRFWQGDPEGALEHTRWVMQLAPNPLSVPFSLAIMYHGGALALTGRWAEFLAFSEDGIAESMTSGSPHLGSFLVTAAFGRFYRGDMEGCQSVASLLVERHDVAIPKYFEAHGAYLLGAVAYERDLLAEAEAWFSRVDALRLDVSRTIHHGALIGLAQVGLARGDTECAVRYSAAARAVASSSGSSILARTSDGFDGQLAAATGRRHDAPGAPPAGADFMYVSLRQPTFGWALSLLRSESRQERSHVLQVVDKALHAAQAHRVELRAVQLGVLRTIALDSLGRRDQALACLEGVTGRAAGLGLVRSLIDCGEPLRTLVQELSKRNPSDAHLAALLEAFETPVGGVAEEAGRPADERRERARTRSAGPRPPDLTNRELDVLELLQRRLSNKEIAARLGISATTVKMHTGGIYRKLGVGGRRQAVARAIELGVLTS